MPLFIGEKAVNIVFLFSLLIFSSYALLEAGKFVIIIVTSLAVIFYSYAITGRFRLSREDILLISFATVYFLGSQFQFFQTAWTGKRDALLSVQHFVPFFLAPLVTIAYKNLIPLLLPKLKYICWVALILLTILSLFVIPVFEDQQRAIIPFSINNLYNLEIFRWFCIGYLVFCSNSRIFPLITILVCALLSLSFQAMISTFLLATLYIISLPTFIVPLSIIACLVISFIATYFVSDLFRLDHNIGVRAMFWRDSIDMLFQTDLFGVGLGTESIKNKYIGRGFIWSFRQVLDEAVKINVHNSFVQVAFRTGVLGLIVFILWLWSHFKVACRKSPMDSLDAFMLLLLLLSLTVNVAFSSINFLFGTCWVLAWVGRNREEDN